MEDKQPRWIERLSVFRNAIVRMAEVIAITMQRPLNQFERDSLIKRFEFTYEMAWKLMMSYEKDNGVIGLAGSKDVVRQAFSLSLIDNGDAWMDIFKYNMLRGSFLCKSTNNLGDNISKSRKTIIFHTNL